MKSDLLLKAVTSKATARKALTLAAAFLMGSALYAQTSDSNPTPSAPGTSKVRIVRLSQVKGVVQIDRHIGRGFENAIANLPVVEQSQVKTGMGVAEIEFEDNSSMRIAPNSLVEFPRLEREASGATASTVHVIQGTAYLSLVKQQNKKAPVNEFALSFGERSLNLDPATHVRLELEGSRANLAVLDGSVRIESENGGVTIPKKKTATFEIFDKNEPTVAKDIAENVFDDWDHQETSYHANMAQFNRFNSPYSYGLSDMSYYGAFVDSSCGSMWRPYFATAAWDPYGSGTRAWYGQAGYSWVSPYPWAWTPYHYGSWMFCAGSGWGWMPGGSWYGVGNVVATSMPSGGGSGTGASGLPRGPVRAPHAPGRAPGPKDSTLIALNSKPVPTSGVNLNSRSFVFQKDSAGLGVPRETLGRLDKFSHETATRGMARTEIYASVPQPGRAYGSAAAGANRGGEGLAVTVHRGSPPSSSYSTGSMGAWSGGTPSAGSRSGGGSGGSGARMGSGSMSPGMGRSGGGPAASGPGPSAPVAVHK